MVFVANNNNDSRVSATDCGDIFDAFPSWLSTRLADNKPVYVQVANEKGVPWEVLAAIHYREFNMAVSNPANGQGIYQLYSSGQYFAPGAVSRDEFLRQTRLAADFIQGKAQVVPATNTIAPRRLTTNDTDLNLIKSTLFSYNGRASAYARQAATYGFDSANQPYEGSPYVMNKFDCKRKAMGLITSDGSNSLTGTDTRMGAFTLYARIKGDGYWNSLQIGNIPGCIEATGTANSCVWKLYNPRYGNYIYTTSYDERNSYIAKGFTYQNTAFFGRNPAAGKLSSDQVTVYRLQNNTGGQFLTINPTEYSVLKSAGWQDLGVAFYADPVGSNTGYAVYRLYNSTTGVHTWTTSTAERANLLSAGFSSEGIAFNAVSSLRQETPPPSGQQLVYRFGNMPGNTHFWTTDIYERDSMIRAGYRYEGVAWRSSQSATASPVYRLYSPTMKKHLYTTDLNEKETLNRTSSWNYETIGWYANPSPTASPVYRLYSPSTMTHFFTADAYERSELIRVGTFTDEGVSWRQP